MAERVTIGMVGCGSMAGAHMQGFKTLWEHELRDFEIVATPWGSGCSFLVTWPLHYLAQGKARAVLGCGDPSARKFMKTDEINFTLPFEMYERMLDRWPDSFLKAEAWKSVKKRVAKSRHAWGEDE